MIYNEKDILKGSERACSINLKDARELFDSRKDSTLNVVRYIVNIVNEYINDIQSGYHNANYYGVGVHEKIVSILEANPKVLEDMDIGNHVFVIYGKYTTDEKKLTNTIEWKLEHHK